VVPSSRFGDPRAPGVAARRAASLLRALTVDRSSLTLQLLGRTLLQAALVGVAAGLIGSFFFYHAQLATKRDSPAHRDELVFDVLRGIAVRDILMRDRPFATFDPEARGDEIVRKIAQDAGQVVGFVDDAEINGAYHAAVDPNA
jgi:hypothetical protein